MQTELPQDAELAGHGGRLPTVLRGEPREDRLVETKDATESILIEDETVEVAERELGADVPVSE